MLLSHSDIPVAALVLLVFLIIATHAQQETPVSQVNIVSILDSTTVESCILKIYSIAKSARAPETFAYYFLTMDRNSFASMQNLLSEVIPNNTFVIKEWSTVKPASFPNFLKYEWDTIYARKEKFEQDHIYARFYLPDIFPIERFIYLDNDVFVTADLAELSDTPLYGNIYTNIPADAVSEPARLNKKVYETHPQYRAHMSSWFNYSLPHVVMRLSHIQSGLLKRGKLSIFINAGVFVVDAKSWREEGLTSKAEGYMKDNRNHKMYSSDAGDQGLFFLMLGKKAMGLHARWNMRRLPKKTVQMLEDGVTTGVVHLAGSGGGSSFRLCEEPLQYQLLLGAVVPLFLSIVSAFAREHPGLLPKACELCAAAESVVVAELQRTATQVKYNPGEGRFTWPILRT